MRIIDLRSDTVTHPTPAMWKAMSKAEVGDDVFGEDPTINKLEALAAKKVGKEAALFTPSGTMSNLIAVLTHTRHGNEIILGSEAHIFQFEVAGAAAVAGVSFHTVPNASDGHMDLNDIEGAIREKNIHAPESTLLCLENTHNKCGGAVLSTEYTRKVCRLAHSHGLKVHLDGARIFNAAIALDVPATELTDDVDDVSFCISKGLSAPVGSLLCGTTAFIERARKNRKMLGGGMRQAGIIAAAGVVALETMIDRLEEDHANAKRLAQGLSQIEGIKLAYTAIPTNIVFFDLLPEISGAIFTAELNNVGVKVGNRGRNLFRAVTHRMVSEKDIDEAVVKIAGVCKKLQRKV